MSRGPARRIAAALAAAGVGAVSCAGQTPVVETHLLEVDPPALGRIAVAPFLLAAGFAGGATDDAAATAAADAAALITRFVTEAFAAKGFEMIAAGDLATAYQAQGEVMPQGVPADLAARAAREFGATALLSGEVYRYRERQGGELGATRAASVGFTLTLHAADGRKLWTARFDKTQPALAENVLEARRYPGAGSRWLSAAQLARWGAEQAAARLAERR